MTIFFLTMKAIIIIINMHSSISCVKNFQNFSYNKLIIKYHWGENADAQEILMIWPSKF